MKPAVPLLSFLSDAPNLESSFVPGNSPIALLSYTVTKCVVGKNTHSRLDYLFTRSGPTRVHYDYARDKMTRRFRLLLFIWEIRNWEI